MKKDFTNNDNFGDSLIFKARIREVDLALQKKLQEIQGAADELARQVIIDKLKQAEVEHEKMKLKLEQEASGRINNILSMVDLRAAENEDIFISGVDDLLAKIFKFFNFMNSELRVGIDQQVYMMTKGREEKEAWIATLIKFLRDKFNKLIKAIFSQDLSFQEKIDQEIGELCRRLFGGSLSKEEEVAILEQLEALRNLKFKLQMFVIGSVVTMFAELFSVEIPALVETTKEECKEKTPAKEKEATKEVCEDVEVKVDPREKPIVTVPVSLFDFSSGVAKPITLSKPELDLLREPIKKIVEFSPKQVFNNEYCDIAKQEVKERQGNESKKTTQQLRKQNVVKYLAGISKQSEAKAVDNSYEVDNGKLRRKSLNSDNTKKPQRRSNNSRNFSIQVPLKTNDNRKSSAERELQPNSINNAQPRGECRDVKVNNHVESIGKAP